MSDRKRQFFERLETTGEVGVRESLALKRYGGDHIGWATLWLAEKDQVRIESATAAQEGLARSQATAARDSADASRLQASEAAEANRIAREANTKADIANTISMLALIAAVVAIGVTVLDAFPD